MLRQGQKCNDRERSSGFCCGVYTGEFIFQSIYFPQLIVYVFLVTGSNSTGIAQRRKYLVVEATLKGQLKGDFDF